jgi:adenine-specific DNA-methyltransferase
MPKPEAMLNEYDKEDGRGKFREMGLRNRNQAFNPVTRPNLFFPIYVDPASGDVSVVQSERFSVKVEPITPDGVETCWTWGREKVTSENGLLFARRTDDGSWRVFRKDYLERDDGELASTLAKSVWLDKEFNNDYGRKSVKELLGGPIMDFPKSPFLIERIVQIGSSSGDIVMDFFAGSGTTGQAVMTQNAGGTGSRRYVLVQLPELLDPDNTDQKVAADFCDEIGRPRNIAEVTKERLRRAAAKVQSENPMFTGDTGFRVFKLDSPNIEAWDPDRENLEQTLESAVEHLRGDRGEQDILFELLLKLGLDLCVPIETREVTGKEVHSIGGGALIVCLAPAIGREDVEPLARGLVEWHKELAPAGETTCVFRDSAFVDDVAKTNLAEILKQGGLAKVESL